MNKQGTANLDARVDSLKESVRGLGERADALKGRMKDVKESVISTSTNVIDRITGFVKDHPFAAIGLAIGVGYLAVRIARR